MTKFILAYNVGDAEYTCRVDATNWDEAERHLLALASTGRVSGEHVADVPVQEPVAWYYERDTDKGLSFSPGRDLYRNWQPLYNTPPDDEALLRQALEALKLSSPHYCGQSDELLDEERMQHRAAIVALKQRLGETK